MNNIAATCQNSGANELPTNEREQPTQRNSFSAAHYTSDHNDNLINISPITKTRGSIDFDTLHPYSSIHKLKKNDMLIHEGDKATNFQTAAIVVVTALGYDL